MTTESSTNNNTLQKTDLFFSFIFKIGEIIYYYIVILFQVIFNIGFGFFKFFLKYIFGFFKYLFSFVENIFTVLFSTVLLPFKIIFLWFFKNLYILFNIFIKPLFNINNVIKNYILGFIIFLILIVYYNFYNKYKDTADFNKSQLNIFTIIFSFFYNTGSIIFKTFSILAISILLSLLQSYKEIKTNFNNLENPSTFNKIFYVIQIIFGGEIYYFFKNYLINIYNKFNNFNTNIIDNNVMNLFYYFYQFSIVRYLYNFILKCYSFFINLLQIIFEHFTSIFDMTLINFIYIIFTILLFLGILYKLYIDKEDNNYNFYYYLFFSYIIFIIPFINILFNHASHIFKFIILCFSIVFISLLNMVISSYYINSHKILGENETEKQYSDKIIYNTIFIFYIIVIIFFINFKILSKDTLINITSKNIIIFSVLNILFMIYLLVYSINYKNKLTNRINKQSLQKEISPDNTNAILKNENMAYGLVH